MNRKEDLSRPVLIHVCKDRTISYRTADEPVFNGVALPVYSVDSKEEAAELCLLTCTSQHEAHPDPNYPHEFWWAIPNVNGKQYLDIEDLETVADRFRENHRLFISAASLEAAE